MFWSGFILISLVPVNSSELQGTELDQTLCISSWSQAGAGASAFSLFARILYFIFLFQTHNSTEKRRWVWRRENWKSLPAPSWGEAPRILTGKPRGHFRLGHFWFSFPSPFPHQTSRRTASGWAGAPSPSPTWWTCWEPLGRRERRRTVTREFLFSAPGLIVISSISFE